MQNSNDIDLFLQDPVKSVRELGNLLYLFVKVSGSKVNESKSVIGFLCPWR